MASIDLGQVAADHRPRLYPAYGALVSEQPAGHPGARRCSGQPELDGGEGINASYAVQWLLFAALALGFPWWFVRRRPASGRARGRARGDGADGPDGVPVPVPRRRRIWDDEDE